MSAVSSEDRRELMNQALERLRSALDLLDGADAPAQIGARVDHAIQELSLALTSITGTPAPTQIDPNAERQ